MSVPQDNGNDMLVGLIMVFVVLMAVPFAYGHFQYPINYVILWSSYELLIPISAFSDTADRLQGVMLQRQPDAFSWSEVSAILGYALRWYSPLFVALVGWWAWRCWDMGLSRFRRRYDARALLERNAEHFPSIAPALQRDFINEPQHSGPWRMEETAIEFSLKRGLLTRRLGSACMPIKPGEVFDRRGKMLEKISEGEVSFDTRGVEFNTQRARAFLKRQLGPVYRGFDAMADYRQALAVGLALFALREREDAYAWLGQLSGRFRDLGDASSERIEFSLDLSGLEARWAQAQAHERFALLEERLSVHAHYENTWLAALLAYARDRGGELAPVRFLWLRGVDRPLWCALHQLGGRTAWPEAAGVWSHMGSERTLGSALVEPELAQGVDALKAQLIEEGWVDA